MVEYFEDYRAGAHIKAHRTHLGVLLSDVINVAGAAQEKNLRFVERAERPAIGLIEMHHTALMSAYVVTGTTADVPLARREQWYATERDETLWQTTMRNNPRVSWWWGVRPTTGERGAWCYLCNTLIHGYDVGRGMTRRARAAVMAHRLTHINHLTADTAQTKGTNTK